MKHELIKKELKNLALSLIVLIIFLKVIFFNTSSIIIMKGTLLLFLTYLIPGLLMTYIFFPDLYVLERYALAILLGITITGILGYYTGIFLHLHLGLFHYVVPLIVIVIEAAVLFWSKKPQQSLNTTPSHPGE